jgi:hypothetical protein
MHYYANEQHKSQRIYIYTYTETPCVSQYSEQASRWTMKKQGSILGILSRPALGLTQLRLKMVRGGGRGTFTPG